MTRGDPYKRIAGYDERERIERASSLNAGMIARVLMERILAWLTYRRDTLSVGYRTARTARIRSNAMRLFVKETTRGGGKVFAHVVAAGATSCLRVRASATTRDGVPVPANLMTLPEVEGWVLILPVLSATQHVTLRAEDEQGVEVCRSTKTIAPAVAKLHSRFNTATHNAITEQMRNCDVWGRSAFSAFVRMDELICAPESGCDVVRGSVHLPRMRTQLAPSDLEVKFLDGKALDAGLAAPLWLDEWHANRATGELVRTFSVRLSHELPFLVIWARDDSGAVDCFECLEGFALDDARRRWDGLTLSAWRDPAYHEWFMSRQRASRQELEMQRALGVPGGPSFSLVVPLYRTPLPYFHELMGSVLAQTYGSFELLLVNASVEDQELSSAVAEYELQDARVKVVELDHNRGIARNTLSGVEAAHGDFVCFLDHDDLIEPDLLYRYAKAIVRHPDTDLIYCDEDKLRDGRYCEPFLKPDWNPDLLCGENYVCHLLTVRRSILDELPQDDYVQCEGSQDHFLTLFVGERARNVWHERRVLYHWRVHSESTAAGSASKPYTIAAGVRAVQAHLDRVGLRATAVERDDVPNTYRVDYEVLDAPLVSIIIPNKDLSSMLRRCVSSIVDKSTYQNIEIIIVENNSVEDRTFELYEELERDDRIHVVRQSDAGTFNYSKTINFGVAHARGTYLVLLNNDTEVVAPDWIERMLGHCQRPEVGCVGAKLVYPDGLIQHAGVVVHQGTLKHLGWKLDKNVHDAIDGFQLTRDVSAVTGACLMIRTQTFLDAGMLDEALPNDFNDTNLCLSLRGKGLLVVYEPAAELIHYESVSRGEHETDDLRRQYAYSTGVMMSRWPSYFADGDPYWSPSLWHEPYKHLQW